MLLRLRLVARGAVHLRQRRVVRQLLALEGGVAAHALEAAVDRPGERLLAPRRATPSGPFRSAVRSFSPWQARQSAFSCASAGLTASAATAAARVQRTAPRHATGRADTLFPTIGVSPPRWCAFIRGRRLCPRAGPINRSFGRFGRIDARARPRAVEWGRLSRFARAGAPAARRRSGGWRECAPGASETGAGIARPPPAVACARSAAAGRPTSPRATGARAGGCPAGCRRGVITRRSPGRDRGQSPPTSSSRAPARLGVADRGGEPAQERRRVGSQGEGHARLAARLRDCRAEAPPAPRAAAGGAAPGRSRSGASSPSCARADGSR